MKKYETKIIVEITKSGVTMSIYDILGENVHVHGDSIVYQPEWNEFWIAERGSYICKVHIKAIWKGGGK